MHKFCYAIVQAEPLKGIMNDDEWEDKIRPSLEYLEDGLLQPSRIGASYDYSYTRFTSNNYYDCDVMVSSILVYGSFIQYLRTKNYVQKSPFSKVYRIKPGKTAVDVIQDCEKELVLHMVKFGLIKEKD